jgi:hypothetical protein
MQVRSYQNARQMARENVETHSERPRVTRDDPRYFDRRFWAAPGPGQNWLEAREEQVAAIKSKEERLHYAISDRSPQGRGYAKQGNYWDRATGESIGPPARLATIFPELVPLRPWCTDSPRDGLVRRSRTFALRKSHVQFNNRRSHLQWLVLDIDQPGAALAHRNASLPEPNIMMINRANGHGHAAVLLANPVARHDMARPRPLQFLAAIERGFARRLGADRGYTGLIAKNPLHSTWEVEWRREQPYTLPDLADWLTRHDMRPDATLARTSEIGRNNTAFNETRFVAYRQVLAFKRQGRSLDEFRQRIEDIALAINMGFAVPLTRREVRGIVKSVSKWTWRTFNEAGLSKRQSRRAKKRWADHVADSTTKPWEAMGISRRTYYYRKKAEGVSL